MDDQQKPLLLMDIDGVLNAFSAKDHTVYRQDRALGFWLMLHRSHPEWVAELEAEFEVMWATMWQDQSPAFAERAGFGHDWEYIDFDHYWNAEQRKPGLRTGNGVGNYKHAGIVATLADRPGAWIDDDMTPQQIRWASSRSQWGTPTLFIQPAASHGMLRKHVDLLLEFASNVKSSVVV